MCLTRCYRFGAAAPLSTLRSSRTRPSSATAVAQWTSLAAPIPTLILMLPATSLAGRQRPNQRSSEGDGMGGHAA